LSHGRCVVVCRVRWGVLAVRWHTVPRVSGWIEGVGSIRQTTKEESRFLRQRHTSSRNPLGMLRLTEGTQYTPFTSSRRRL
jgi:cytochrome b